MLAFLAIAAGVTFGLYLEGNKEIKGYPGLGGDFTLQAKSGEVSLSDFEDKQPDVFNFFIPYFLFLFFEVYSLTRFLQKK